ncbi:MAG: hypothetical protein WDO73_32455 [Ignavibacteriota bacterium]
MPLKADDLKTIENYKKAIRLDLTRLNAQGNTKFWIYKDMELPTASGSKQKLPVLISLVDDLAVKAVLKGKQALCRGLCGLRDGQIFFEADQGKLPYAILKKSVPLLFGKPLHVPSDAEEPEEEDEEASSADALPKVANAPTGTYARLNAAWKQLSQEADRKMGDPDARAALTQLMNGIPEMLQSGKLDEAEKRLAQLNTMLKNPLQAASAGGPKQEKGAPYPGLVKYRTALVQFAQAKSQVKGQIHNLRSAILQHAPDQKDFADELAGELEELNDETCRRSG